MQLQLHVFLVLIRSTYDEVVAAEAVELVGNRHISRAVDKCVGSSSVHALIHGPAPVIHKSIAIF